VTANNRIAPEDYPHHITSDYLDGYRARRIEQLIASTEEHDTGSFEAMQMDMLSLPGLETVHRLARLEPRDQRELAAIERLRLLGRAHGPEVDRGDDLSGVHLRLGREVARAAIGDRDLAERWLDRADNGFVAHVTSPWRWQSHLLSPMEEADDDLVGRPWDQAGPRRVARSPRRSGRESWARTPRRGAGARSIRSSSRTLSEPQIPCSGGSSSPAGGRRSPGDRRPGRLGSERSLHRHLGAVLADGRRPAAPEASRWQAFTGQSGHPASDHYDDLQERWKDGRTQAMAGEGPWRTLTLEPS